MAISFDAQLINTAKEIGKLIERIDEGEPTTSIVGYRYPDDTDKFLERASPTQIDYAIADLERSKVGYHSLVLFLRQSADKMNEVADLLETRDTYVNSDIERMHGVASRQR